MIESFKSWLAVSPIASGLRTAFAFGVVSALNFVLDNFTGWDLPLVAQLALASVIPPIIRSLNPNDGVFGKGAAEIPEAAAADAEEPAA